MWSCILSEVIREDTTDKETFELRYVATWHKGFQVKGMSGAEALTLGVRKEASVPRAIYTRGKVIGWT